MAFDRKNLLSEHKAKLWVDSFRGGPTSEDNSYNMAIGGRAYDSGDRLPPVKLIGHCQKQNNQMLEVGKGGDDDDEALIFEEEPDLPCSADYDSRKGELHQIFKSAFKY